MKYKAVIFDLFGTLIDNLSLSEYENVLLEIASILGASPDMFRQMWLDSFRERITGVLPTPQANIEYICRKLKNNATEAQIERAARVRLDFTARAVKPRPGSLEMLSHLKAQSCKIGLISDCSGEVPIIWKNTPFAPFFDVTVFSCVAGVKKPDPRIYHLAIDSLGVKPQDCLYIGDGSSNELTGALGIGMHPVLIRDPNDSTDANFSEREDDWSGPRISSLKEILDLLK